MLTPIRTEWLPFTIEIEWTTGETLTYKGKQNRGNSIFNAYASLSSLLTNKGNDWRSKNTEWIQSVTECQSGMYVVISDPEPYPDFKKATITWTNDGIEVVKSVILYEEFLV